MPGVDLVRATETEAKRAHGIERQIKTTLADMRAAWVQLAQQLTEFHALTAWAHLGYDSFEEWLASPDVELSRTRVFALIQTYHDLVLENGVPPEKLAEVDMTKAEQVLPAIRRGQVTWNEALSDAKELSFRDLRERYRPSAGPGAGIRPEPFHWESCPSCGSKIKVRSD